MSNRIATLFRLQLAMLHQVDDMDRQLESLAEELRQQGQRLAELQRSMDFMIKDIRLRQAA